MIHVYAAVVHCSDKLEETLLYKRYCLKKIKTFLENGIKNRIFCHYFEYNYEKTGVLLM